MRGFSDHKYLLYLNRKIYIAIVKLQADQGLGKSYSALLPLVEGLHTMKYLSDEDYEIYRAKYSVGLEEAANCPTLAQIRKQETKANRDRKLNRHYSEVLKQWTTLSDDTKAYHLKKAEEDKHLKFARDVLKLGSPQETEAQK